jgi:hypothetical protein
MTLDRWLLNLLRDPPEPGGSGERPKTLGWLSSRALKNRSPPTLLQVVPLASEGRLRVSKDPSGDTECRRTPEGVLLVSEETG